MSVRVLFEAPRGCFTDPLLKIERSSYPAMTPPAAVGALSSIWWKREIAWRIISIRVLNPIAFIRYTTNEVKDPTGVETLQRSNNVLRDVAYLVEADFDIVRPSKHNRKSYQEQIERRMRRGASWSIPYMGMREMMATYRLLEENDTYEDKLIDRDRDIGMMIYNYTWSEDGIPTPIFKQACLRDGLLQFED